jgi:transposase-like protein
MARRPTSRSRGREAWKQVVDDLGRSGLSVARYAREHGLSARTLTWWRWALRARHADRSRAARRKSARAPRGEPRLSFVPVSVVADPTTSAHGGALRVVLAHGRRIDVRAGFDGETLARLVRVLEATSC